MAKPTMDDVARRAGVSRALVSLALSGSDRVSDASRSAVLLAADELGYRPNLIARNLASKQTRTVGLIVNDLHNPYFPGIVDGIKRALGRRGYRLLLNSAFLDDGDELAALDTFIDFRVDGIILVGSRARQIQIEAAARSIPMVVASRPLRTDLLDTMNNDDRLGATLAVEHLVRLGHRHIWHIDGADGAGAEERRIGYATAMERHGLQPRIEPGAYTEAAGAAATDLIFGRGDRCTAIFAANDLAALGALDAVAARGMHVPRDVALVGYDNTFVAALRHVGLTSIDQNRERLGELAVDALLERIEDGRTEARHVVITPMLVTRATCGQGLTVSATPGSGGSPAP